MFFWAPEENVGKLIKIIASNNLLEKWYGERKRISYGEKHRIIGHSKMVNGFSDIYGVLLENEESIPNEFISFNLEDKTKLEEPIDLVIRLIINKELE